MIKQENKLLGATVPQEWIDKFEAIAKQRGCSVTELVREALGQYLGVDQHSSTVLSQLPQLLTELKIMREKITELELYKIQIRDISIRLAGVEQGMGKVNTQFHAFDVSSSSKSGLVESEFDEEYDDEPDEILSDFLPISQED